MSPYTGSGALGALRPVLLAGATVTALAAVSASAATNTSPPGPQTVPSADQVSPGQGQPTEKYSLADTWTSRTPNNGVPEFERPAGVDVAPDGTIYVADSRQRTVYHLDDRGRSIDSFAPSAEVGIPLDVAVSADRVYVIGPATSGGEIRDRQGQLIRNLPLSRPAGVAVGADNRLYVAREADINGNLVAAIDIHDADGNFIEQWSGEPLIRIRDPLGLDVAVDGTVYLAADGAVYQFQNGQVTGFLRLRSDIEGATVTDVEVEGSRVWATAGDYVAAWQDGSRTTPPDVEVPSGQGLAVGPRSGLVVSSFRTSGLAGLHYLEDRTDLGSRLTFWGRTDEALGELIGPSRVAAGSPPGHVFMLDSVQRAQHWSAAGEPLDQWTTLTATDIAGGGPTGCIIDGREVTCLAAGGATAWTSIPAPPGWLASTDGHGTQVLAVDLANQALWQVDRGSGAVVGSQPLGDGAFTPVSDVAVDVEAVFLVDRATNRIVQRNLDGAEVGGFSVERGPVRVAAAEGAVFVSTLDGWVWKYARDGTVLTVLEPPVEDIADIGAGPGGRLYVADTRADRVLVYEPEVGGQPPGLPPPPPRDDCQVEVDKRARPAQVRLGQKVAMELEVSGACPFGDEDLDIMMVIDRSGSMLEPKMTSAKSAAISFVSELNPRTAQVGVVAFSTSASLSQPLTGDLAATVGAVADLQIGGQTFYEEALDLARTELTGPTARPGAGKIVVMLTDGQPTDRTRGEAAAERLKAEGATVYVIGLGPDIDADLLGGMASTPDLYFEAPTEAQLAGIYREIARRIGATKLLRSATVVDELPADMVYVLGSARPAPRVDGRVLTWSLSDVPASGTTMRYEVRPTVVGLRPTNVSATMSYVDALANAGDAIFPVPQVEVLPRLKAYLPAIVKAECRPQRADVVLVIDTSSSMTEPAAPGSSAMKIDAALQAARTFLDRMALPHDRAAVVSFDSTAQLVHELTGSRAALEFALAGIRTGRGTRIDLGIEEGLREILGPRHEADNTPVMIVLTDGKPAGGSEGPTMSAAVLTQELGVDLYTIGLGDADQLLLQILVNDPGHFYFAPDANGLAEIYEQIAGAALCQ